MSVAIQQVMPTLWPAEAVEIKSSSMPTSSAAVLLASTNRHPEPEDAHRARRKWFADLLARLDAIRRIKLTPIEMQVILSELEAARYTYEQAQMAELWILYGDWVYEGKGATLKLSDFYPDAKRIQYLLDQREIVLIKRDDLRAKIRHAQEQGYQRGRSERSPLDPVSALAAAYREIARLKCALWEKEDESKAARNYSITTSEDTP